MCRGVLCQSTRFKVQANSYKEVGVHDLVEAVTVSSLAGTSCAVQCYAADGQDSTSQPENHSVWLLCSCVGLFCLWLLLQACAMLPQGHTGEWHFCRGVWETEKQTFKSYADYGECEHTSI